MEEDSVLIDCHESEYPSEAKQRQQYHSHLNTAPARTKRTTRKTLNMISNEKRETGHSRETLRACEARAREYTLSGPRDFALSPIGISVCEYQEKTAVFC